jgi:hypothetical protein
LPFLLSFHPHRRRRQVPDGPYGVPARTLNVSAVTSNALSALIDGAAGDDSRACLEVPTVGDGVLRTDHLVSERRLSSVLSRALCCDGVSRA